MTSSWVRSWTRASDHSISNYSITVVLALRPGDLLISHTLLSNISFLASLAIQWYLSTYCKRYTCLTFSITSIGKDLCHVSVVCACVCLYLWVCVHACVYVRLYMLIVCFRNAWAPVNMCMCMCLFVSMGMRAYACCICTHESVNMYECIIIYVRIIRWLLNSMW